jgi:hypothetical protein
MIPCLKTIYLIINLPRFQKTGEKKKKVHGSYKMFLREPREFHAESQYFIP